MANLEELMGRVQSVRDAIRKETGNLTDSKMVYDMRKQFSDAAERAIRAKNLHQDLATIAGQIDGLKDPDTDAFEREVAVLIASSSSSQQISNRLRGLAELIREEGDKPDTDLFGAYEKVPPHEIARAYREREGIKV